MSGIGQHFPQFSLTGVVSSPDEVLRVLDALQTGEDTLKAA